MPAAADPRNCADSVRGARRLRANDCRDPRAKRTGPRTASEQSIVAAADVRRGGERKRRSHPLR